MQVKHHKSARGEGEDRGGESERWTVRGIVELRFLYAVMFARTVFHTVIFLNPNNPRNHSTINSRNIEYLHDVIN